MSQSQTFKPRYPTRNAGFWFAVVSLVLSYATVAMLIMGVTSNNKTHAFDWGFAFVVSGIALVALVGTTLFIYLQMRIKPRQVVLDETRLLVEDISQKQPKVEVEIPLDHITWLTITDVPVEGSFYGASFKGLVVQWEDGPPPAQECVISSRNICNFDNLFDQLYELTPKEKRGARTFRP